VLCFIRAFAGASHEEAVVHQAVGQIPWGARRHAPDQADGPRDAAAAVVLTYVAGCSLVIDALSARKDDEVLRQRLSSPRTLRWPARANVLPSAAEDGPGNWRAVQVADISTCVGGRLNTSASSRGLPASPPDLTII
jgi:hypothetical protein